MVSAVLSHPEMIWQVGKVKIYTDEEDFRSIKYTS